MQEYIPLIAAFIFSNLASEAIKYIGVKLFKKIDSKIQSPLD